MMAHGLGPCSLGRACLYLNRFYHALQRQRHVEAEPDAFKAPDSEAGAPRASSNDAAYFGLLGRLEGHAHGHQLTFLSHANHYLKTLLQRFSISNSCFASQPPRQQVRTLGRRRVVFAGWARLQREAIASARTQSFDEVVEGQSAARRPPKLRILGGGPLAQALKGQYCPFLLATDQPAGLYTLKSALPAPPHTVSSG